MKARELKGDREVLYINSGNRDAVKSAQRYLNEHGYTDAYGRMLEEDGVYGKNTFNAVIKYQRDNGLTEDGKIGDDTWNHMWDNPTSRHNGSEHSYYADKEYNTDGMKVPKYYRTSEKKKMNEPGIIAPFFYNHFDSSPSQESEIIKEERERQGNLDEYIRKNGWSNYWTSGMN